MQDMKIIRLKNLAFAVDVIGDDVEVIKTPTDDNRSYHVSSKKIQDVLSFEPQYTIKDAIEGLREAFKRASLKILSTTKCILTLSACSL